MYIYPKDFDFGAAANYLITDWQELLEELMGEQFNNYTRDAVAYLAINASKNKTELEGIWRTQVEKSEHELKNITGTIEYIRQRSQRTQCGLLSLAQPMKSGGYSWSKKTSDLVNVEDLMKKLERISFDLFAKREITQRLLDPLELVSNQTKYARNNYWEALFKHWAIELELDPACSNNRTKSSPPIVRFIQICSEKLFPNQCEQRQIVAFWSGANGLNKKLGDLTVAREANRDKIEKTKSMFERAYKASNHQS